MLSLLRQLLERLTNGSWSVTYPQDTDVNLRRFDQNFAGEEKAVPLVWWSSPAQGNFGDWLSPILLESAFKVKPYFLHHKRLHRPHVFGIGSIAKYANRHSLILGSGIIAKEDSIDSRATARLLRGPHSASAWRGQKTRHDLSLGDPGILLKLLLQHDEPRSVDDQIAFIPHYVHEDVPLALGEGIVPYRIWANSLSQIRALWTQVATHSGLITSSLHAYIGAQSLGIPVALVDLDHKFASLAGDGIKFADYALGAGVPVPERIKISGVLTHRSALSLLSLSTISAAKIVEVQHGIESGLRFFLESSAQRKWNDAKE